MSGSKTTETGKRIDVLPKLQFDWIAEVSFYAIASADARTTVPPKPSLANNTCALPIGAAFDAEQKHALPYGERVGGLAIRGEPSAVLVRRSCRRLGVERTRPTDPERRSQ